MKRRLTAAALAALAGLTLAACGPSEGRVVEKHYEPARWIWTTCYRTETYTSGGTTSTRQVPYSCQQYQPDRYQLYLKEETLRDPDEGWRGVNGKVYMACEVGSYYREGVCS